MEAAWKGALVEAERLCDVHNRVRDDLYNEVIQQVKTWQKDNYHKVIIISAVPAHCYSRCTAFNFVDAVRPCPRNLLRCPLLRGRGTSEAVELICRASCVLLRGFLLSTC